MGVDQAGNDPPAVKAQFLSTAWHFDLIFRSDGLNVTVRNDDDRIKNRGGARSVEDCGAHVRGFSLT